MDAGFIPELELDCIPRPGEFVVCSAHRSTGEAHLSAHIGANPERVVGFAALRYRGRDKGVEIPPRPLFESDGSPRAPAPGDTVSVGSD